MKRGPGDLVPRPIISAPPSSLEAGADAHVDLATERVVDCGGAGAAVAARAARAGTGKTKGRMGIENVVDAHVELARLVEVRPDPQGMANLLA